MAHKRSQSVRGSHDKGQKQAARSKGATDVRDSLNKSQAKIENVGSYMPEKIQPVIA